MAWSAEFTTKEQIHEMLPANLKLIYPDPEVAIPTGIHQRGEALVWSELLKDGRFDRESVNITDINLQMAAENAVLWLIQKNGILPGFFGQSGEVTSKGASGVNVSYGQSRGGQIGRTPEVSWEQDAPDYYHAFQRHVLLYLQDPGSVGNRIDMVEPRVHNAFDNVTQNFMKNRLYDPFRPHR